jgi:hypothetical protein
MIHKKIIFLIISLILAVATQAQIWSQTSNDFDGEAAGDESGTSVSLSADGSVLAIGVPFSRGYKQNK